MSIDNEFDRDNPTDFDLDSELDLDLDSDTAGGNESSIPKSRVSEIVQKRIQKERNKMNKLYDEFKNVYGMTPDEAIPFGLQEVRKATTPTYTTPYAQTGTAGGMTVGTLTGTPAGTPAGIDKVAALEQRVLGWEESRRREMEAAEFIRAYPNTTITTIPKEVLDRRAQGGVTLTEAFRIYMADKQALDAAKHATQNVTKNIYTREAARVEGADYSGGAGDTAGSLTEEERRFANVYGMSAKDYVAYKTKSQRIRDEF